MTGQKARPTLRVLALLVLAGTVLSGCALFAAKGDYRDYRAIRLADDDQDRAIRMAEYVEAHPEGSWAAEVRAERAEAEPSIFEATKSTRDGLAFYLRAYPNGTYSAQAQQRLAALSAVQGRRDDEASTAADVRQDQRDAAAELRRSWGTRAVGFWTRILVGVDNWGSPIAQVAGSNADFSAAFGQQPRPRCSVSECIKFYQLDYAIPIPGRTREERTIRMLLRLRMQDGNLVRAEMLMPNRGFSRWYELENRTLIFDADPEARNQAVEWALQRIVPIIREAAPGAHGVDVVAEPIDPPTVLAPNQPDPGASAVDGEVVEAEGSGDSPAEGAAPAEGETPAEGAAPAEGETPAEAPAAPTEAPAESAAPAELVLPVALQGLETDTLRFVVFSAADDDEGPAYDGFFIEHLSAPPAEE